MKATQQEIKPVELIHNIIRGVYRARVFFYSACVTQTLNVLNVQVNDETWQVDTNDVDKLMTIHDRFKAILGNNLDGNLA